MPNYILPNDTHHRGLFISHASEDKEDFARPLAVALKAKGLQVWFDEFEFRIGDNIRQKIDDGLRRSQFGLVVLSRVFFQKYWTQYELDGLFAGQAGGGTTILPVWHRITKDEIARHSFSLTGIFSLNSATHSIDEIADKVAERIRQSTPLSSADPQQPISPNSQPSRFAVFYIASVGTPALPVDSAPEQPQRATVPTGWVSLVKDDEDLEYDLDGNVLRIRLDLGNVWSSSEYYAQSLLDGEEPFALVMRPIGGSQQYFPIVRNSSRTRSWPGQVNRSGWMKLAIQ